IRTLVRPEQEVRILLTESMNTVNAEGREAYRGGVESIAAECRQGRNVAFVTEGDPTLYSTAANVWHLLAEMAPDIDIEVIPGVRSITAAAARVRRALAQKDERLAIIPASYHADELPALLEQFETVCLLKVSQALPQLVEAMEKSGPMHEGVYVENLGTSG